MPRGGVGHCTLRERERRHRIFLAQAQETRDALAMRLEARPPHSRPQAQRSSAEDYQADQRDSMLKAGAARARVALTPQAKRGSEIADEQNPDRR